MASQAEPHKEEIIQGNPQTAVEVPLDISRDDEAFLLSAISIQTPQQLKEHIFHIQAESLKVMALRILG